MARPHWLDSPTTATIGGELFHMVVSPADEAVRRLEDADTHRDRVIYALIALHDDPGCIEAHLFLAEYTRDDWERLAHLEKAIETGRALWEPVTAAQDDFSWWGVSATRPYMRAIATMAEWHADREGWEEAIRFYEMLMTMNPHDNQGIRYKLAELHAEPMAPVM